MSNLLSPRLGRWWWILGMLIAGSIVSIFWPIPFLKRPPRPPSILWSGTDGVWRVLFNDSYARASLVPKTVLIFDWGPCEWLAQASSTQTPLDLSGRTGGEYVWCARIIGLLHRLGYSTAVTAKWTVAEEFVRTGLAQGVDHIMFSHWGWEDIVGDEAVEGVRRLRSPFSEDCLIKMNFWGTNVPTEVWPGDLKFYLTIYPSPVNAYTGPQEPEGCPVVKPPATSSTPPFDFPYAVVYGKFNVRRVGAHTKSILPVFRDRDLWTALQQRLGNTRLVFVTCSYKLWTTLRIGYYTRSSFICVNKLPPERRVSYSQLLLHARFVLGLGTPLSSPTPIEALWCRTPVILPASQHPYIASTTRPPHFHAASSANDVLAAVDAILRDCRPAFRPRVQRLSGGAGEAEGAGPKQGGDEGGEVVEKVDEGCFARPPQLVTDLGVDAVTAQLRGLLDEKWATCSRKRAIDKP